MTILGDFPGGTYETSHARAVNNRGWVAGHGNSILGTEAFLWTRERGLVGLGVPPGYARFSRALGINDSGQIAGQASNGIGFLWDEKNGMTHPFARFPNSNGESVAWAINNAGQVSGAISTTGGGISAFLWDPQNGTRLLDPYPNGGWTTDGYALNDRGQVAGTGVGARGMEAFLWDAQRGTRPLGTLGGRSPNTYAFGINERGQVVGMAMLQAGVVQAFIWEEEHGMRSLNKLLDAESRRRIRPPWFWRANDINDFGEIVVDRSAGHAHLLVPFIPGDMNCDGAVTHDDFAPLLEALARVAAAPDGSWNRRYSRCGDWIADVNQDGRIDAEDALALWRKLVGLGAGPAEP